MRSRKCITVKVAPVLYRDCVPASVIALASSFDAAADRPRTAPERAPTRKQPRCAAGCHDRTPSQSHPHSNNQYPGASAPQGPQPCFCPERPQGAFLGYAARRPGDIPITAVMGKGQCRSAITFPVTRQTFASLARRWVVRGLILFAWSPRVPQA